MIIKFNNKVLTISNKWCNGDNIPPLYEDPTILYPKNTSVVNSLQFVGLPTITQRYLVVSFDNKPYIPDNTETSSSIDFLRQDSRYFFAYNYGAFNTIKQAWVKGISFASAPRTYFDSFTPVDNIGTVTEQQGIGGGVYFTCYENYNLYRNNEYTHFKMIADTTSDTFYLYLNNIYVGHGTVHNPLVSYSALLHWYEGSTINSCRISGQSLKNIEIVSFNDFDSAAAYT